MINESQLHAGHRSSPGTGESHFRVLIVSPAFAGKSRVERHRLVNGLLADRTQGRVHALALTTLRQARVLVRRQGWAGPNRRCKGSAARRTAGGKR